MPLPAHYAVTEGVLAGAYPGTAEGVRALERSGVTVFVDLTHPSDPLAGYDRWLDGTRRIPHPIPDMGTPTAGHVIQILDEIDAVRADGGTVYVHCWGGIGRTGTVVGCLLVRHGLDAGDAIARIAELRREIPAARPSPETSGQAALVRGWRLGR
jgi:hypothetical protein